MKKPSQLMCWIYPTVTIVALAGSAALCHAASPIVYDFASDLQGWSGAEPTGMAATYTWNSTNGSTGGGCMQVVFDGTTTTEMDPQVTLPAALNQQQYLGVSIHLKVDSSSGTTGTGGSGGYGNLQAVFRDASFSWDSMWYGAIYPPAANDWVTYNFIIVRPYHPAEAYLQFQLQASGGSAAPVTVYIDNVTITPVPNPWLINAFTNSSSIAGNSQYNLTASWDSGLDAPYVNPVNKASNNISPPGSVMVNGTGNGYPGLQLLQTWDPARFQYVSFDVYVDGASGGPTLGGVQIFSANGAPYGYSWTYLGGLSFNAGMVGKWTHFDFPSAASGITNAQGYVFQLTAGNDGGTNPVTIHIDNVQAWTPAVRPILGGLTPGTTGGVKVYVDDFGTANQYDQEGFSSPAADNAAMNFFWLTQAPASYSFTLTNFPSPAVAPGFGAHVYLVNGDSITANLGVNLWNYNQTYSGVPYNAYDYAGLRIENSTNDTGVIAIFEWKTNMANANPVNQTTFNLTGYASANGTWTLNFSDDVHVSIVGPNGTEAGTLTLPGFLSDPTYQNNFNPNTSMVQFGVSKHDVLNTGVNNNQSAIFTHVAVTNMAHGVVYDDSFLAPKLTGTYSWQVAQYYLDPANRVVWIPQGTAWWLKWDSTQSGWSVQSSSNLLSSWADAGVTYTYVDNTGTNTVGAIPAASLPAGNAAFFRLANPNP